MGGDHTAGWVVDQNLADFGGTLDPLSAEGQVEASRDTQLHMAAVDTMGICDFAQTGLAAPGGMENVYTIKELVTICAAREIKNNDIVFCGTGISMLAAMAAKNINAPDSVIFFEIGAIDLKPEDIPLAVVDLRIMYHTSANGGAAARRAGQGDHGHGDDGV